MLSYVNKYLNKTNLLFLTYFFLLLYSQFPFSNAQVRILLYRECDWRGRKLLFDSTAIQKVNLSETSTTVTSKPYTTAATINSKSNNNSIFSETKNKVGGEKKYPVYIETSNGYGYKYAKPESDYNGIGEMVFGSVAMSFRATTLKVCDEIPYSKLFSSNKLLEHFRPA